MAAARTSARTAAPPCTRLASSGCGKATTGSTPICASTSPPATRPARPCCGWSPAPTGPCSSATCCTARSRSTNPTPTAALRGPRRSPRHPPQAPGLGGRRQRPRLPRAPRGPRRRRGRPPRPLAVKGWAPFAKYTQHALRPRKERREGRTRRRSADVNQQYPDPVVTTAQGTVRGLRRGGTRTFLNFPYAAPPRGAGGRPAAAARAVGGRTGRDPAGTHRPQSARRLGDIDMTPLGPAGAAARTTSPSTSSHPPPRVANCRSWCSSTAAASSPDRRGRPCTTAPRSPVTASSSSPSTTG
ncbi:hypothetical protein STENM327S_03503 [Streptomyces tendae]